MTINKEINGTDMTITLTGRLDSATAPELAEIVKNETGDVTNLVFDITDLEYVSSAGLRAFIMAHKNVEARGEMTIKGANSSVKTILSVSGLTDILNIE